MARQEIQTRYLLGKLSDAESASLEERSFLDDNVFDEIEIAEDELIDAYVGDSLSAEDRERFENKLLKSGRVAERVEFARLLSRSGSPQALVKEPAKTSWWPGFLGVSFGANPALTSAAATALVLVMLALPVFIWMRLRFAGQLDLQRAAIEQQQRDQEQKLAAQEAITKQRETDLKNSIAEEARLRRELEDTQKQLAAQEQLAKNNRQPLPPASILLYSTSVLGGPDQPPVLSVSPPARTIQLRLVLDTEDDYVAYRARINSSVNYNVLTSGVLRASRSGGSRIINFSFPAEKLPPGEYSVRVTGRTPFGTYEPVGDFQFKVEKNN